MEIKFTSKTVLGPPVRVTEGCLPVMFSVQSHVFHSLFQSERGWAEFKIPVMKLRLEINL